LSFMVLVKQVKHLLGIHLKILHDELPKLRVIITGSSSVDMATNWGSQ